MTRKDSTEYRIAATWDDEAGVWIATSEDVPGLVAEATTFEELIQVCSELVPELLRLNGVHPTAGDMPYHITAERSGVIHVAA